MAQPYVVRGMATGTSDEVVHLKSIRSACTDFRASSVVAGATNRQSEGRSRDVADAK